MKKLIFSILTFGSLALADQVDSYVQKALEQKLFQDRYWHLLLHADGETSEIDTPEFFLAPNGKESPKDELIATIKALYNETRFDDNSTACSYPARKRWLQEKLTLTDLPDVTCNEYNKIYKRLDPVSATLVFPSAHINSPASMYGHTFLRINSSYHSKLLSYAVNYAADADPNKTNGIVFAIKGLFGGYFGNYSLLPYYDKLKEYRDTENRDIWEFNLNLSQEETIRMVEHIWEIRNTYARYFFFNRNCSYEMLWLLEVARPTIHLRDQFFYPVIPLETVYALQKENLLESSDYRPSKRSIIEAYKSVLNFDEIQIAKTLYQKDPPLESFLQREIDQEKKRYILEVSIELLQYYYQKGKINKEEYLERFHNLTTARASLGKTKKITPQTPINPLFGHQANRFIIGGGMIEEDEALFIGYRPAYHSLEDSPYGFLRGTQIEFGNFALSATQNRIIVEDATLVSVKSIAQIDEFFTPISWKVKFGWDTNSFEDKSRLNLDVGIGSSIGNSYGYTYIFTNLFAYDNKIANFGGGGTIGLVIDKFSKYTNTFAEYTYRYYDNNKGQQLIQFTQNFRVQQNFSLALNYIYKEKILSNEKTDQQRVSLMIHYYF